MSNVLRSSTTIWGGQAPERPPYTDPPLASRPIDVSVVSVVPVFTRFQNVSELEV